MSLEDVSSTDLAYIAGFADADGSFGVSSGVRLTFANCYIPTLRWIQDRLGGAISPITTPGREHVRQCYRLTFYGDSCRRACRMLYPYLRQKQREAELLLTWGEHPPQSEARKLIKQELKELKRVEYPSH